MNRRSFVKATALGSVAACTGATRLLAEVSTPAPAGAMTTPPVLQNVSETGITVLWTTSTPATGWVEYGETEKLGRIANGAAGGLAPYDERVLQVRIDGLKPGQTYHYRVHTRPIDFRGAYNIRAGTPIEGPVYRFTTLDATAGAARFVIWNDTHQNKTTLAKLIERLPKHPADFLLWNGDIFNDVTTEEVLITETLHPAGLEYAATRPLVFSRGNHDVRGAHARSLTRTLPPAEGRYYFRFRQGPVAFIVLDTGEDKPDDTPVYAGLGDFDHYRSEQRDWLARAIQDPQWTSAPFRVLITHIPLRGCPDSSSTKVLISSPDSQRKWEPLLAQARIDFAFCGHTHRWHYSEPTAQQPWPLVVGGGPQPAKATYIHTEATTEALEVTLYDLEAHRLGHWRVTRSPA